MIARFLLALPFYIAVLEGAQFNVYTYENDGYVVSVFPPSRSDSLPPGNVPDNLQMNDTQAFLANGLRIEFRKDIFDRSHRNPFDPPESVINSAVKLFLDQLRYVTQSPQVHTVDLLRCPWRIRYLNDDGSELIEDASLPRGRGGVSFNWSWVGLNTQIWENIHSLSPDFIPPAWNILLLDAEAALPNVGTAVVLAATCLEVFIEQILGDLAKKSELSSDLWTWLNKRKDHLKNPSVEEQFDVLLKYFTGRSLKEDKYLWASFINLKTARNKFVHEGLAKVGDKLILPSDAARLVGQSRAITKWVRELLPDDLKWPEFEPSAVFTIEQAIIPQQPNASKPIDNTDAIERVEK